MVHERIPIADNMSRAEVAEAYNQMASRSRRPYRFWAGRALGRALLKEGRAIDIGSGPGYLLVEMAKLAPNFELYGLDNSSAMLKLAEKNVTKASYANQINLIEGTVYKIPFEDNYFDLVISTNVLHGIDDLEKFFEETYRVLKMGGFLRVYTWRRNAWSIITSLAAWQARRFVDSPLAGPKAVLDASYTSKEIKKVLTKIPFRRATLRASVAALTIIARK